jgi:hypothetical protein
VSFVFFFVFNRFIVEEEAIFLTSPSGKRFQRLSRALLRTSSARFFFLSDHLNRISFLQSVRREGRRLEQIFSFSAHTRTLHPTRILEKIFLRKGTKKKQPKNLKEVIKERK